MTTKRITLIRHGMPEAHYKYANRKILKGSDLIDFIKDWNNCGLSPENKIPEKLKEIIRESDIFISSGLKRSIDSLRLSGVIEIDSQELLNEADLPHGFLLNLKLPVIIWGILIRLLWFYGLKKNSESYKEFKTRVKEAYNYTITRTMEADSIVVMGHGFINMHLKRELKRNSWNHCFNYGGHGYWSFDIFEKLEEISTSKR
jgi:hypothetical protein